VGGNAVAERRIDLAYNADGQYASIQRYDATGQLTGKPRDLIDSAGNVENHLEYDAFGTNKAPFDCDYSASPVRLP
jgi:hypothetical protein